jgi:retinol-binding protein 3
LTNFGFAKVQRLPGNVGYLRLHAFFPAAVARAGATAVAAMNFIAETSALIVDVDGSPPGLSRMVTLLASYLFAEPVQLTSIRLREPGATNQFWTYDYVAGPRYADKPIYVLTGPGTLSAAEGFVYALKRLRRATIVGETTGGAAHVTSIIPLDPHFAVSVPFGCAVDPITGTTWEGTGVAPDIEVPSPQAFTVAHRAALKHVIATLASQPGRACDRLVEEARAELAKLGRPTPGNIAGSRGGR